MCLSRLKAAQPRVAVFQRDFNDYDQCDAWGPSHSLRHQPRVGWLSKTLTFKLTPQPIYTAVLLLAYYTNQKQMDR